MATPGYYENPSVKSCYETCRACLRCAAKVEGQLKCIGCSGRHDPVGRIDPDPDDVCTCSHGVLRWKTREGRVIVTPYQHDPFKGGFTVENKTEDEKAWGEYLQTMREKMDNPDWDPIVLPGKHQGRPIDSASEFTYLGKNYGR